MFCFALTGICSPASCLIPMPSLSHKGQHRSSYVLYVKQKKYIAMKDSFSTYQCNPSPEVPADVPIFKITLTLNLQIKLIQPHNLPQNAKTPPHAARNETEPETDAVATSATRRSPIVTTLQKYKIVRGQGLSNSETLKKPTKSQKSKKGQPRQCQSQTLKKAKKEPKM